MRHLTALILLMPMLALAEQAPATEEELQKLVPTQGPATVTVGSSLATIKLPEHYSYLDKKDAQFFLERVWGNPHRPDVLGMILREDEEDKTVGIVISYDDSGHVEDADAAKIDFNDLLKNMQEGLKEANPHRQKEGYPTIELEGWAEPPHYDSGTKKLYWATKLIFGGAEEKTVNYNVRILGRTGTLVMNAIASLDNLPNAAEYSKEILAVTEFTPGKSYADFVPSADKVAAGGIAALIAGKVLLKAGFFAAALKFLAAFAKPLLVGVAALGTTIARMFGRKKDDSAT